MKFKSLKRFSCVVIASAVMCTSTVSAFADSNDAFIASTVSAFDNSNDEFIASAETQSASNQVYGPGRWYMGQFSFTDYNIGRCYTINGNRLRICIAFKPIDGLADCVDMNLSCYRYDGKKMQELNLCFLQDEPDDDGYRYYVLDWVNVSKGVDYYYRYSVWTCGYGANYPNRKVDCHVWLDIE